MSPLPTRPQHCSRLPLALPRIEHHCRMYRNVLSVLFRASTLNSSHPPRIQQYHTTKLLRHTHLDGSLRARDGKHARLSTGAVSQSGGGACVLWSLSHACIVASCSDRSAPLVVPRLQVAVSSRSVDSAREPTSNTERKGKRAHKLRTSRHHHHRRHADNTTQPTNTSPAHSDTHTHTRTLLPCRSPSPLPRARVTPR